MNCIICNNITKLIDVVDFNKTCEEPRGIFLPISGIPVYYAKCDACDFVFAPEICKWSESEFIEQIYNEDYIKIDPDYSEVRPISNSNLINKLFGNNKKDIKHLDYGGGNGKLSDLLNKDGWDSKTYDPFPANHDNLREFGKFDLITAFEVFEHVPDANDLMNKLKPIMNESCIVLFSTLLTDGNIIENQRITWWYASPRNGHISLFSRKSLEFIGRKFALKFGSFSGNLHCYFNRVPSWAQHIIKIKAP